MLKSTLYSLILLCLLAVGSVGCNAQGTRSDKAPANVPPLPKPDAKGKIHLSNAEWKARLSPQEYYVMFQAGTERAFTGKYWDNHAPGTYLCNACKQELFTSETKFESGTGWPSFYQPIRKGAVLEEIDPDGFRTEVRCSRCNAHLGHVFDDGPKPTGLRYCMNSVSLAFKAK